MSDKLFKVELGCGKTKTEGYIGVDRFPLEGVDIIADINIGLPFENDSIDVIYACHSLEHLENLSKTMTEIYRVCKNEAIVQILAPYSFTSLDQANFYHKIPFNEDTFRFCTSYSTDLIDSEEYYCPHSYVWGLEDSDNSSVTIQFEPLDIEFFYYKEYRHLNSDEKRHARRAFNNVCDQIFYVLVVNKTSRPFSEENLRGIKDHAKSIEPPIINALRVRDFHYSNEKSILTDIKEPLLERQQFQDKEIGKIKKENKKNNDALNKMESNYYKLLNEIGLQKKKFSELEIKYTQLLDQLNLQNKKQIQFEQMNNDSIQRIEQNTKLNFKLWKKLMERERHFLRKEDLYSTINGIDSNFIDQIKLHCTGFKKDSTLNFSKIIPSEQYFEYFLHGYGEEVTFYLRSIYEAHLLVEVVQNCKIVKQETLLVSGEAPKRIYVGGIKGPIAIRFRVLNEFSIVKVLEVWNRKFLLLTKVDLAATIE